MNGWGAEDEARDACQSSIGTSLLGVWRKTRLLLGLSVTLVLLDIALAVVGPPTTGWAGPHAHLIIQLVLDVAVLLLPWYPRWVAGFALVATGAMAVSDAFSPGLLVPIDPVTSMTLPTATPIIIIKVAQLLGRPAALWIVGAFAVLGTRLWDPSWEVTPVGLLNTVVPALGALYFQARQELLHSLRVRAERAEREQRLLAEQARSEERRRLAAEMHDVVTHQITLMVLHAGALGVRTAEPDTRKTAKEIRESGARALKELRELIGVLRDPEEEVVGPGRTPRSAPGNGGPDPAEPPAPDPAVLVEESRSVGIAVEFNRSGSPSDVSPTVARTAYRIVQEALTNVRKHAPGSEVTVVLRYHAGGVELRVDNSAPPRPADPALAASGSGTGLTWLRQRVQLVGGSLDTRSTGEGGYQVRATLPAYVPTAGGRSVDSFGARR